ncbi:hypothetical protein GUJ93_ZPchr0013g33810 [Zizania palustris]|uniref:Uncharacterized protein n=1 Tax=Zizania palustris TaxID=103762 RepID=A0A8J6BYZ5_ZIZPA|nr:hypothetical protein GUJ93_ZPchr0013g33810 [Zizania palustris]
MQSPSERHTQASLSLQVQVLALTCRRAVCCVQPPATGRSSGPEPVCKLAYATAADQTGSHKQAEAAARRPFARHACMALVARALRAKTTLLAARARVVSGA